MEQDLQRAEEIVKSGELTNELYVELEQLADKHGDPNFGRMIEAYLVQVPDLKTLNEVLGESDGEEEDA